MGDMYRGIDGALEREEFVNPFRSYRRKDAPKALWQTMGVESSREPVGRQSTGALSNDSQ